MLRYHNLDGNQIIGYLTYGNLKTVEGTIGAQHMRQGSAAKSAERPKTTSRVADGGFLVGLP